MKNYQNLSILFWIFNAKASKVTGKAPLYVRLTIEGARAEMSIGVSIQPSLWDKRSGKAKGRGDDVKIVNAKIDAIRSKILRHYNHLISLKDDFSAEELKNEYLGIKEKEKTLMEVFNYHNQQMEEKVNLGIVVPKTHLRYKITKNKVLAFIQYQYKKNEIYLSKIKYQFVVDFEHYLRVKQNLCNNTAMKYIKNLKKK